MQKKAELQRGSITHTNFKSIEWSWDLNLGALKSECMLLSILYYLSKLYWTNTNILFILKQN